VKELHSKLVKKNSGFTLIEVLVATIILASLVYLSTLSYSLFLRIWQQGGAKANVAVERYRTDSLLRSSLDSIYDYYVTDPANEKAGFYYPFFKGGPDEVEFVTLSSVFRKGWPAVARLRMREVQEREQSHYQVVYEETPLQDSYVKYNDFSQGYQHTMIVYDNVKNFRLRYFGEWEPEHVFGKATAPPVIMYKWQDSFYGRKTGAIPRQIDLAVTIGDDHEMLHYRVMAENVFKRSFFTREF